MNETETLLSNQCRKLNWYCRKLNTHTIMGTGTNQVSDFIICNNKGIYFIECKQRKEYFHLKDLTQQKEMFLLNKKSKKAKIFILLNFYFYEKLYLISYNDWILFLKSFKKKGLNHKDLPEKYLINIKNLENLLK